MTFSDDPLFAGHCLDHGHLLFYPTETFYAIGCKSSDHASIENIIKLKKRPPLKSLPLIAGDLAQAGAYCDLSQAPPDLLEAFWPGPLTLVLPALRPLHPALLNREGKAAIRLSSSTIASSLARQCGEAIISSSANISGQPPAKRAQDLDPRLFDRLRAARLKACVLCAGPEFKEEKASAIVEARFISGKWRLSILRQGAITEKMLLEKNFDLLK